MKAETLELLLVGNDVVPSSFREPSHWRLRRVETLAGAADILRSGDGTAVDVVLAALSLPDSRGFATFEAMRGLVPATPMLVAVLPEETELGLICVEQGAEDYVEIGRVSMEAIDHAVNAAAARGRRKVALVRAKEEAEEATRLKDKFVSLVAHDLRGPLGAILGLLQLMSTRTDVPLPPVHRENLEFIIRNGHNLLNVVEDLLDLSRLQTGKIVPEPGFVDGHYAVEIAQQKVALLASQKAVTIRNDVRIGTRLYTDAALFGQVVQNLLSNAIKFSRSGSEVIVRAEPVDGRSRLAVHDRGVGIPAAKIPKLFRLEEKVSTKGTAGESGTGFGLPLCAKIMEAMDGSLTVESVEGQGSTFFADQPLFQPRVLVVDDDNIFLRLLSARLQAIGADVAVATNGRTALEHLAKGPMPHLVLADLAMPEMDGFQLLRALKNAPQTAKIPVIVVTGDNDIETRRKALGLGADDFTVKPIIEEDFIPRVRRVIA